MGMRREVAIPIATLLVVGASVAFFSLGQSRPRLTPENVRQSTGVVGLAGFVVEPPRTTGRTLRFILTDRNRTARVQVLYPGAAPVSLHVADEVNVTGVYRDGEFLARADTLIANCGTEQHC
jgi:cytochrome c-type biogenesis protein CcmE